MLSNTPYNSVLSLFSDKLPYRHNMMHSENQPNNAAALYPYDDVKPPRGAIPPIPEGSTSPEHGYFKVSLWVGDGEEMVPVKHESRSRPFLFNTLLPFRGQDVFLSSGSCSCSTTRYSIWLPCLYRPRWNQESTCHRPAATRNSCVGANT